MEVQEYELTQFKSSDFKDQNGNIWCDAVFLGIGEPVKWVVKDPSKVVVGQKYYGKITDETSKANKPYQRFRREKRPEEQQRQGKREWQPRDDMAIRAQWSINAALQAIGKNESGVYDDYFADIETYATKFYAMVDRVKGSDSPKVPESAPKNNWEQARQKFHKDERDEDNAINADMQSLMEQEPQS